MSSLSLPLLALVFLVAAAVVWLAGDHLTSSTDAIDKRFGLGDALGGLLLLAIATNLPEIGITASAAWSGHLDLAIGNLLGGIAVQTVVIVVLDFVLSHTRRDSPPLTTQASSVIAILEAITVIAVLLVVIIGSQLPGTTVLHVDPVTIVILLTWIAGIQMVRFASKNPKWRTPAESVTAATSTPEDDALAASTTEPEPISRGLVTFGLASLATLIGGVALQLTGDEIATELGINGVIFGATVLALATSIPEISTGIASIVRGDTTLALSDILGGNAFLPVLLLLASAIAGQQVVSEIGSATIYLAALGCVLTAIYIAGLVLKPRRRVWDLGLDSLAVLMVYGAGLVGFAVLVSG